MLVQISKIYREIGFKVRIGRKLEKHNFFWPSEIKKLNLQLHYQSLIYQVHHDQRSSQKYDRLVH